MSADLLGAGVTIAIVLGGGYLIFGRKKKTQSGGLGTPPATAYQEQRLVVNPPTLEELELRLKQATSQETCASVYNLAPAGSDLEVEALQKYDEFLLARLTEATTANECWSIYDDALVEDSAVKNMAYDKAIDILTQQLNDAKTVGECKDIYEAIPGDDFDEKGSFAGIALDKMLTLCVTTEDCLDLNQYLEYESADETYYDQILRKALVVARTVDDCSEVGDALYDDVGPSEEEVELRKVALAKTVEECAEIWDDLGDFDDTIARAAILRAADIIKAEESKSA